MLKEPISALERDELPEVIRERDGERRDRARRDDEKARPSVEERRQRSERVAQIDVQPARLRIRCAELRVRERTEQRQEPGHRPDRERESGMSAGLSQHATRDEIDPRADHGADRDQHEIREAEAAPQLVGARHACAELADGGAATSV